MRRQPNLATRYLASVLPGLACQLTLGAREFEDQFGRVIEAELVAHWGAGNGYVKIDKGGDLLTVKLDAFSEKDQEGIVAWIREHPKSLAALAEPKRSGEGLVAGTKWFLLNGPRRTVIEFAGASLLRRDGVLDKESHWAVNFEKDITIRWPRFAPLTFSQPIVSGRIYRTPVENSSLLVKIDRPPGRATVEGVAGKTFVLAHSRALSRWGLPEQNHAVIELMEGGKASLGGKLLKWRIDAGSISLQVSGKRWTTFVPSSQDVSIDRAGHVLWEVSPPDTRRR